MKVGSIAINPKREEVQGQKAWPSLDAIDEPIDLAVVATPATSIPGIVEACGEQGIKMMLILSAGFRETGPEGRRLEDRVIAADPALRHSPDGTQLSRHHPAGHRAQYYIRLQQCAARQPGFCLAIRRHLHGDPRLGGNERHRFLGGGFNAESPPTWISATTWISWFQIRRPRLSCCTSKVSRMPGVS